mgnify:CR=1 FL=1
MQASPDEEDRRGLFKSDNDSSKEDITAGLDTFQSLFTSARD